MQRPNKSQTLLKRNRITLYPGGFEIDGRYFAFDEIEDAKGEFVYRHASGSYVVTLTLKNGESFVSNNYDDYDDQAIAMVLVSKITDNPLRKVAISKIWLKFALFWLLLGVLDYYLWHTPHRIVALVATVLSVWIALIQAAVLTELYSENLAYEIYREVYGDENSFD